MADSADDSTNPDAAILALIRFLQEGFVPRQHMAAKRELLRSFLEPMAAYMSKTCPR